MTSQRAAMDYFGVMATVWPWTGGGRCSVHAVRPAERGLVAETLGVVPVLIRKLLSPISYPLSSPTFGLHWQGLEFESVDRQVDHGACPLALDGLAGRVGDAAELYSWVGGVDVRAEPAGRSPWAASTWSDARKAVCSPCRCYSSAVGNRGTAMRTDATNTESPQCGPGDAASH